MPDRAGAPVRVGPHPHIRSFHARRTRITRRQAAALAAGWPRWGVRVDGEPLDLAALFGDDVPVVLEIGFGMGDTTAAMAAAEPGLGILAVDVHAPGVGNLLHLIEQEGLTNVHVARGDAVVLVRDMLLPASLAGVRLYFPDPWPKARHHKRRLVQPPFVSMLVDRLVPGGTIHCATDWLPYADHIRDVLAAEPRLTGGAVPRPSRRPVTRFEREGLAAGRPSVDLVFTRRHP